MTESLAKLAASETSTVTTNWVPPAGSDYVPLIIKKAQASRLLAGVAAAYEHLKAPGTGKSVRVRILPKRTAQGPVSENGTLTDTATTPDYIDVTPLKYGDRVDLTFEANWFTNGPLLTMLLQRIAEGIARKFDKLVWDELEGATPGASATLAVSGDLTTNDDFLVKILDCQAAMQKLDVDPDYILMGPDQLAALRKVKAQNALAGAAIDMGTDGQVAKVGGMTVINCKSVANASAATAALVHAMLIDSSRAFVEARLGTPSFKSDEVIESDYVKHVYFDWFGVAEADTDGIGHVKNAAA